MNPSPQPKVTPSVAVIDIGSNSIKVLVAARSVAGGITALTTRTIDARISAGISKADPRLTEEGIARGLDAIGALLKDAAAFSPATTILVATSAVRDAKNGADFRLRVLAATGLTIRILTGDEEAHLIGRGLTCDPARTCAIFTSSTSAAAASSASRFAIEKSGKPSVSSSAACG